MSSDSLTLDAVEEGRVVKVLGYEGRGGWVYRMYQMGLVPGSIIEVLVNNWRGPVIVRVMGVEVAVGRGLARRIRVQVVGEGAGWR
ncbi:ferrous iron transport protein A [Thermosphaera chiliense]|uniref:Ferrous iron transport protein A n=1 Tax=Thermosphaera chiliense TaxID=3402707 RepID=A0A7M1UST9_9CREN|nr:FeoA family protein [Thermosphaera aggregans]QOR94637.1 ferrous iron transport protein A [Thermosphaera aggregans]